MENRRRFVGVHDSSGSLREWERRLFEAERRQSRGRNTRLHLSRPPTPCGLSVLEHLISRLLDTLKSDQSHLGHLLIWVMSFTFAVLEIKTNNLKFSLSSRQVNSSHHILGPCMRPQMIKGLRKCVPTLQRRRNVDRTL